MSKSYHQSVIDYYNTPESRHGYMLFLKGTKHFGFYKFGDKPWNIDKALRQMEHQIVDRLDVCPGDQVLDAGCGMGDVARFVARQTGSNVIGIDILDFNLTEATKRAAAQGQSNQLNFKKMSYDDLTFEDNSMDAIYTTETFVHAQSPEKVLAEFYRVLKPGGRLVQLEYSHDPFNSMSPKAEQAFTKVNQLAAMPTFQRLEHGVHESLVAAAGFTQISVTNIMNNILPMLHLFAIAASVPYMLLRLIGKQDSFVNAMSAVEFWRYRKHIHVNIVTAIK